MMNSPQHQEMMITFCVCVCVCWALAEDRAPCVIMSSLPGNHQRRRVNEIYQKKSRKHVTAIVGAETEKG